MGASDFHLTGGLDADLIQLLQFCGVHILSTNWLGALGDDSATAEQQILFYLLIGTTYGSGDGSTTFNVPINDDRFIRGWEWFWWS